MEIFVGNLPFDITEQEIRDTFAKHGEVSNVKMLMDKFSGRFRGIAFVTMNDEAQAQAAVDALNNVELGGRPMRVDKSRERTERFGGFGGGFNQRGGGFRPRSGGFRPRFGDNGGNGGDGYRPRGDGFRPRGGGGFRPRGNFRPRENWDNGEGGDKPRGGFRPRSGGFRPRDERDSNEDNGFRSRDGFGDE